MKEIKYCDIEFKFKDYVGQEYDDVSIDSYSLRIAQMFLMIFKKILYYKPPINEHNVKFKGLEEAILFNNNSRIFSYFLDNYLVKFKFNKKSTENSSYICGKIVNMIL